MSHSRADRSAVPPSPQADEDASLQVRRWDAAQHAVRERWNEPIEKATAITQRTLAWFPIRVWRHFLQHNGFLLAAGMSYQSLFAIFGVLYLGFATIGLWLGGSAEAVQRLIDIINGYIPDIISENGLVTPEQVESVATGSSGLLTVTGAVAIVIVIWTAIGFITYTRRAVRDTFGLAPDPRSYVLLKARDLVAAVLFGLALLLGAVLGSITTGAVDLLFTLAGWNESSIWSRLATQAASLLVAFTINAAALAGMFRFLTGTTLPWRRIWPGSLLGGAALVVMQLGAGLLLVYTPSNPLLATFAIFIGFLLWFRINGIVILVAAAWIAVAASDRNVSLLSEAERERQEFEALITAARVRVRDAERARADAPWYLAWAASVRLNRARDDLAEMVADAPPQRTGGGILD